jgi:alkylation response protein AidB-like acyl-CoA dehydrogenase
VKVEEKLRSLLDEDGVNLPLPGRGETAKRHRRLAALAREDLTLARLAEAHADAVAILVEAGRSPVPGARYGVWASEIPNQPVRLEQVEESFQIVGTKSFCTGAGIVDRALVTVRVPEPFLVDVDLRKNSERISYTDAEWITAAFAEARTATAVFRGAAIDKEDRIGPSGWYLNRPGFWHGACGPASCWAGGAMGLLDYALGQRMDDPHGLAHVGAMEAARWSMFACLDAAGNQIDSDPDDREAAILRALSLRHVIEQACVDVLQRFGRAYGPRPLAFYQTVSRRYQEVELYIRQSHAERDLEALGRQFYAQSPGAARRIA